MRKCTLQDLPPDYVCAAEIAETLHFSLRHAQELIQKVPILSKIRVGRTIYVPVSSLPMLTPVGNPRMHDPVYQSIISRMRWHPEQRTSLQALLDSRK